MDRRFYLDLAAQGLRMPIGAHLVLSEKPHHEAILLDGPALGAVVAETARRYHTPLALPLMDLAVEKADMLAMLGMAEHEADAYHFPQGPTEADLERLRSQMKAAPTPRMTANLEAIRHVAGQSDLVACGMAIGPFSLMTKLLAEPITPVFMAGSGVSGADEPEVQAVEIALEMATLIIERGLRLQAAAGARAICLCEPAANMVYLSPNQLAAGSDVFERLVMVFNRRLKKVLQELDCDLIFHDCGELTDPMLQAFCTLDPAVMSLGSSRRLWEDQRLVPKTTVLFGNLPTKKFYSDVETPVAKVEELSRELVTKMRAVKHPFILGSECDVLSVPGSETTIKGKVQAMMTCAC